MTGRGTGFGLAATICFTAVAYGLFVYATHPDAGFSDVYPALFPVVPGLVFAARALGKFPGEW